MKRETHSAVALLLAAAASLAFVATAAPTKWTEFVRVEGQPLPIPVQWLQDPEARTTHNLKLPSAVPQPIAFDFDAAWWKAWLPRTPKVAVQYFNHLCSTEAGEWIFRKVKNVEGVYFARPQGTPTTGVMTDPYGPEMPWIQRQFMISNAFDRGESFVAPPWHNYHFVEQPKRNVKWQARIDTPYVRLFGLKYEFFVAPGHVVAGWNLRAPMQVVGIDAPTAQYGYTWRGLRRERDREFGIAGGEILIYELATKEVIAVRRQFLVASTNPRGEGKAMWEVAAKCPQLPTRDQIGLELRQFAFDVLETEPPSKAGKE